MLYCFCSVWPSYIPGFGLQLFSIFFLRMKFAVNSTHSTDECLRKYVFQLKEENEKLRKDLKVSNQAREEDKIR